MINTINNQNSIQKDSITDFLNEKGVNPSEYETKSYSLYNDKNEPFVTPTTFIQDNSLKYKKKLSLNEFFKKVFVNDIGAHVILETYNDEAIWRKEFENIEDKKKLIHKITIPLYELAAAPMVSRRFINLNHFNVKELISEAVKEDFVFKIDNAILFGNGLNQPKGLLTYNISEEIKDNHLLYVKFDINDIMNSLVNMESLLDSKYLNEDESIWIISRKLYMYLQKEIFKLNSHPLVNSGIFGFSREGTINYLFNRPILIIDKLENNKNKIEIILINKNTYTILENPQMEYIENQKDIDVRLYFMKYYGGAMTNNKGIIVGILP